MLTVKNWGYLASPGHFEIVAEENGEKPKSDISITQPLSLTVLPHLPQNIRFWGWEISRIGENILLCNDSLSKIQDDSQLWPIESVSTMKPVRVRYFSPILDISHPQKQIFWCKCGKTVNKGGWVIEMSDFGFSPFSAATISKWPRLVKYPQFFTAKGIRSKKTYAPVIFFGLHGLQISTYDKQVNQVKTTW